MIILEFIPMSSHHKVYFYECKLNTTGVLWCSWPDTPMLMPSGLWPDLGREGTPEVTESSAY